MASRRKASSLEMVVSVLVVCAVAAGGLALTYAVTKDRIAEQDRLLQMLNDVIGDEKLDLKNEQMISKLLNRIDVDHIRPIAKRVDEVHAERAKAEAALRIGRSYVQDEPLFAPDKR